MKKNLILGGILLALIGLAYIYQGPLKKWQEKKSRPENFFEKVDIESIDKISIIKEGKESVLEKKDNKWIVKNDKDFAASPTLITAIFDQLKSSASAKVELVSENKNKKIDFQTDENGLRVKLFAKEKEAANFTVGKLTNDYRSSYVSREDIDSTYLLNGVNLFMAFANNEWRDMSIFAGNTSDQIKKLRFQVNGKQFIVEKKDKDWFEGKNKLNQSKLDRIATILTSLNAADIPVQDFKPAALDKSQLIVQATGEGVDNTIMVGKDNGKGMFYAKRSDSDNIYLINKTDRDDLNRTLEQLK